MNQLFPRSSTAMLARFWVPLLMLTLQACRSELDSPHRWAEFKPVPGQAYPVPTAWLKTEAGRLAHDLLLPDSMPKPVEFDFTAARWKSWIPGQPSVQMRYWEHLCKTEAGQFIFKTVSNVDHFAHLRLSPLTDETAADEDQWLYEAPGFERTEVYAEGSNRAHGYLQVPFATYLSVEFPTKRVVGWERISRRGDEVPDSLTQRQSDWWRREPIEGPTAQYAVTWRGLRRPLDRDNLIAGFETIVLDRKSGEVLAVVRDFSVSMPVQNSPRGFNWRLSGNCPQLEIHFATLGQNYSYVLVPRVLQPSSMSQRLIINDANVQKRITRKQQ